MNYFKAARLCSAIEHIKMLLKKENNNLMLLALSNLVGSSVMVSFLPN